VQQRYDCFCGLGFPMWPPNTWSDSRAWRMRLVAWREKREPSARHRVPRRLLGQERRSRCRRILRVQGLEFYENPFRGAGGNRTPVHQPVDELATTIPGVATDAVTPTGRLSARGGPRSVFPVSQQSFLPSAVFPAVIPHFCCRAVMDWPRAALLLTMFHTQPDGSGGEGELRLLCGNSVGSPV